MYWRIFRLFPTEFYLQRTCFSYSIIFISACYFFACHNDFGFMMRCACAVALLKMKDIMTMLMHLSYMKLNCWEFIRPFIFLVNGKSSCVYLSLPRILLVVGFTIFIMFYNMLHSHLQRKAYKINCHLLYNVIN